MGFILVETPFNPVTMCGRCGRTKREERADPGPCTSWGTYYETHVFLTKAGKVKYWRAPNAD